MNKTAKSYDCDCPPPEHFFEIGQERLDYLEDIGQKDVVDRVLAFDGLADNARKTFTIFLAGIWALLGYAIHLTNTRGIDFLFWSVAATCLWLVGCAYNLYFRCIKIKIVPSPYTPPGRLFDDEAKENDMSKAILQAYRISFLCIDSHKTQTINTEYARNLDKTKTLAACITPLVFFGSLLSFYLFDLIPKIISRL